MRVISLAVLATIPLLAQTAEKTFGAAQHKEEAEGDLSAAIAGYKKVIAQAGKNRALAAQAQLRMGMALEKLGDSNARAAYEQLLRNYGDQKVEAEQAKARLAVLGASRGGGGITQRTIIRDKVFSGEPSASGRYLPFEKEKALWVYDRTSNSSRMVVPKPAGKTEGIGFSCISPDEKWMAYYVSDWAKQGQVRIVGVDGSGDRLLRTDERFETSWPASWSPDGKTVATVIREKGGERFIYFLDAASGATRRRVPHKGVDVIAWSPEGEWVAIGPEPRIGEGSLQILRVGSGDPAVLIVGKDRKELAGWLSDGRVVYTSDSSGMRDLLAVPVAGGKLAGDPVVLKKDLGRPERIRVSRRGDVFGETSLRKFHIEQAEIDIEAGVLRKPATQVNTRFSDINSGPAYSPDGRYLTYVSGRPDQADFGIFMMDLASGETRRVPASFPGFPNQVKWFPDGRSLVVYTAGMQEADRALHKVDVESGKSEKISAELVVSDGATNPTISPDGRYLYYKSRVSQTGKGAENSAVRRVDLQNGGETIIRENARLFALSPDGKRMLLSLRDGDNNDSIAVMPAEGGPEKTIYSYPTGHLSRAWGGLWWSADGRHVFYHFGKNDADELWVMRADGSEPKKVLETAIIRSAATHSDNRRIVMHTASQGMEIWVMEGVTRR